MHHSVRQLCGDFHNMLASTISTFLQYAFFHKYELSPICLLPQFGPFHNILASTMRTFPHYAYFHNEDISALCLLPQWRHFRIMLTSTMRTFLHYDCFHNVAFMWIISLSQTNPHFISIACFASTFLIVYISICLHPQCACSQSYFHVCRNIMELSMIFIIPQCRYFYKILASKISISKTQ